MIFRCRGRSACFGIRRTYELRVEFVFDGFDLYLDRNRYVLYLNESGKLKSGWSSLCID